MQCTDCNKQFEYFPGEETVYSKFNVPLSKNCHECRQKRQLTFRNERKLYYNKSYKSQKQIIALYPSDNPFKIIDQDEWWDDNFDATQYGRDFDFNKPFFEQFKELQLDVPRWSRIFIDCENSDFTNNCANVRNSYLAFSCHDAENLYYCVRTNRSNHCIDCFSLAASEYCSNCIDCEKCYNVHYSQLADNCRDSYFLFDCRGCQNCILCAGIRNKQYMVLNEKLTKYEYEEFKKNLLENLATKKEQIKAQLEELKQKIFHRNLQIINSENCVGDFIINSKNIQNGYNITESRDCINVFNSDRLTDCYDCAYLDKSELCIECDTSYEAYNSKFSTYFVGCKNSQYLDQCFYLQDCFGCIGLKKGKYLIFNKQYEKVEYEKLIKKIEEHMKKTGEYGQPFPKTISSFAYNDTVAQEKYYLDKEQALLQGLIWSNEEKEAIHFGKKYEIPKDMNDVDESICDKILTCEKTGKNYKIIPQELSFYRRFKLPVPRVSPDQRYKDLLALKREKKLYSLHCHFCRKPIKTTYSSNTSFKITCEDCYLKTIY